MAKKSIKKGNTGKRYGEAEKQKILAFVDSRGRGGISAACKKFNVSYIALRRWMNRSGAKPARYAGAAAAPSAKLARGLKKAVAEAKALRKQITALHRLLRSLG